MGCTSCGGGQPVASVNRNRTSRRQQSPQAVTQKRVKAVTYNPFKHSGSVKYIVIEPDKIYKDDKG